MTHFNMNSSDECTRLNRVPERIDSNRRPSQNADA